MTPVGKGRPRHVRLVPYIVAVTFLVLIASNLRVFVVMGASDAPTLLYHDRVLVLRAAYDLFVPFTDFRIASWADPAPGDLVLCRVPGVEDQPLWIKRVVAGPGDLVEVRDRHLVLNGVPLPHVQLDPGPFRGIPDINRVGAVVAVETLGETEYKVTYTPGTPVQADHGPVRIPEGHYFLLGDSRDHSRDSRAFGTVPRSAILGAYATTILRSD